MKIKLRPYQVEAVDAIQAKFRQSTEPTLLNMTMGLGKTLVFLYVLKQEREMLLNQSLPFRALILAHREELVYQPRDRVADGMVPGLPIPGIVKGNENEADAEIVVATVQTLMRRKRNGDNYGRFYRLREVLKHGKFTHIITDECHHAVADSYMKLYRALTAVNPEIRHLGVTATPKRSDEDGLIKVYKSVAYRKGLKWAIEAGYLAPFVANGYKLPVSIRQARVVAGDYAAGDLNKLLSADNVEDVIINKWLEDARLPDGTYRQTMAFCAGVIQAERLAVAFRAVGIKAEFADGNTDKATRRKLLSDFRQGNITVLTNCMLWTEGFDAPSMSCVIMARPTKSSSLYLQAVGRGLRRHPNKSEALIMDFAPQDGRDLIMAGDLLGVPAETKKRIAKAQEDEDTVLDVFGMFAKQSGIDADPDDIVTQVLDFFANETKLQFTHDGKVATAGITSDRTLAIVFPQEDRLAVADSMKEDGNWSDTFDPHYEQISSYMVVEIDKRGATLIDLYADWETAVIEAEEYANGDIDRTLAEKAKSWRKQKASDKQRSFASRLGVWRDGMSRGQCAQAITHKLALNKLKKGYLIK